MRYTPSLGVERCDKYAGQLFAPIEVPSGASFADSRTIGVFCSVAAGPQIMKYSLIQSKTSLPKFLEFRKT